ncbi:hypothetical protein [Treponema berlinense]|uniref:hypothetical protein n=1 Tax=Treponema berlinense TaxID=225004 RepID=UPI0026F2C22B|nr:hypothetical protein [Treponema berlinense]
MFTALQNNLLQKICGKTTTIFALSLTLLAAPVQKLHSGEFTSSVEDARTPEQAEPAPEKSITSETTGSSSSDSSGFVEFLLEMLVMGWGINNIPVRYTAYPYKYDSPKYLNWNPKLTEELDAALAAVTDEPQPETRAHRYSLSDSFFYLGNLGTGNEFCFEGLFFPVIGPYFENLALTEQDGWFDNTYGNIRLGGQMALISSNIFSATGIIQWSRWYGNTSKILKDSGLALGMDLLSYPIKPICLQWKFCWQTFTEEVYIFDSLLSAGILLGRLEIFAGWKVLEVGNTEHKSLTKTWQGASAGCRLYF